eukprot:1658866-Prymnesium_polylepis.1
MCGLVWVCWLAAGDAPARRGRFRRADGGAPSRGPRRRGRAAGASSGAYRPLSYALSLLTRLPLALSLTRLPLALSLTPLTLLHLTRVSLLHSLHTLVPLTLLS